MKFNPNLQQEEIRKQMKKEKQNKIQYSSIRLDVELNKKIIDQAETENRSKTSLIENIVKEYYKNKP